MAGQPLARKRCAIGPSLLVEKKIRVTRGTASRLDAYIMHADKKPADAWRDVINAGLSTLGFGTVKPAA
jgi:hypothetical protein